ncbi:MAG: transglycosylase domain-containing protein [Firmicutes bacterium]|nr:transglycosylase domain-containing protein [Bacillota bacterium]
MDKKSNPKPEVKQKQPRKKTEQPKKKKTSQPRSKNRLKPEARPFTQMMRGVFALCFILAAAVIAAGAGVYIAIIKNAPAMELVAIEPATYTSIIYDSNGNELDRLHGDENREYATLDKIPKDLQHAFVAIEDARFYEHDGVDMRGFARAAFMTLSGADLQGGSTLTQQLIKNNVTKMAHNTAITKIQEQYLAENYERELTEKLGSKEAAKNYILELYLNTIGLGHGYNGVQAASLGYFGKDVEELSLSECAVIAAITNNPSLYSPRSNPEGSKKRQTIILNYMCDQGYITAQQRDEALADDVFSRVKATDAGIQLEDDTSNVHSYFIDALFDQVSQDLQNKYNMTATQANYILYNGGLEITATIDNRIQSILDKEFADNSNFPAPYYGIDANYVISIVNNATGEQINPSNSKFFTNYEDAQAWAAQLRTQYETNLTADQEILADKATFTVQPQSAMVVLDYHNGEVKAIAGGRGEKTVNRAFNRATDAVRQPGSVFKVLAAYAANIDTGTLTASSIIRDEPFSIGKYTPKNWWGDSYRGDCTVRVGIRDSMNILAVKAIVSPNDVKGGVGVGIDVAYDYLLNFGFTTLEDDNHAATALGGLTNGVKQTEVCAAYGTIANGGEYRRPMFYSMVKDHSGNVLLENNSEPRQVLSTGAAYVLTDIMRDVVKSGTGTEAKFRNSEMPVVGKTGTTTNSKDLTFVGYTPYYAASVWLGYDRYDDTVKNMNSINQHAHLTLWRKCMEEIHQGLEVKDFEMPEDVVKMSVCKRSGMRANSGCASYEEVFVKGTEPDYCTNHWQYSNSETDGEDSGEDDGSEDGGESEESADENDGSEDSGEESGGEEEEYYAEEEDYDDGGDDGEVGYDSSIDYEDSYDEDVIVEPVVE